MSFCSSRLTNAVWELTLRCNAKCLHCGSSAGVDRKNNLTYEEALQVVHQLAELKCQFLTLIGGEYFLYPKWKELLAEFQKTSIWISIVTNGLLLTKKNLDFLIASDVKGVGISLDGSNPKTHDYIRQVPGCFRQAVNALQLSRQARMPTTAITTINRLNIAELKEIRSLLLQNGIRSWQLQHTNLLGRMQKKFCIDDFGYYVIGLFCAQNKRLFSPDQLTIHAMHCMGYYSKTIPDHSIAPVWTGCMAGHRVLGIRSNGDVLGCLSLYDDKFIEGNIREKPLPELWKDKCFCRWNKRFEKFKNLDGFCKGYPYSLICLGGCSSFAENQRHCYYEIEKRFDKNPPQSPLEKVLRDLTRTKMDKQGYIHLPDNQLLSQEYIDNSGLDPEHKKMLSLLIP